MRSLVLNARPVVGWSNMLKNKQYGYNDTARKRNKDDVGLCCNTKRRCFERQRQNDRTKRRKLLSRFIVPSSTSLGTNMTTSSGSARLGTNMKTSSGRARAARS